MASRGKAVAGSGGRNKLGTNKETQKLADLARGQGWTVEVTGGNHLKWTPPPLDKPRKNWTEEDKVRQIPEISGLTPANVAFVKLKSRLAKKGLNTRP
ncbi:hypothetical protein EV284_3540 [Streptomyces sp. BK022]|uniref:hypothetical protein n=1 Tax=Streptomyces sp. BK022 TaxID=2512123 RepID=UPI001029CBFF|nr:hypothetical protein [Streptomyces sp. BK022]RZU36053.1 hypothetical protein EV284_3540 [Streptomyces sp. BK022]